MAFSLGPVGQIALGVADADRSEAFYGEVLGLKEAPKGWRPQPENASG